MRSSTIGSPRSPTCACTVRPRGSSPKRSQPKDRSCRRCPATPFDALLKLERRVSHDGLVSIGGNYYSVPDRTRRVVEVQQLPDVIRILDQGCIVAVHPVLEGRRRTRVAPEHRQGAGRQRDGRFGSRTGSGVVLGRPGDHIPRRSLEFYQAIGNQLAVTEDRS